MGPVAAHLMPTMDVHKPASMHLQPTGAAPTDVRTCGCTVGRLLRIHATAWSTSLQIRSTASHALSVATDRFFPVTVGERRRPCELEEEEEEVDDICGSMSNV